MLRAVSLVEQLRAAERGLPDGWTDARLSLAVEDGRHRDRALALLGPLGPGRVGGEIRFSVARSAGPGLETLRRILRLLDAEEIDGTLALLASEAVKADEVAPREPRPSLVEAWDAALGGLPEDWSDLHCELELDSSDYLERAALLTAPLNPLRYGAAPGFLFRVARSFGYGASPQMAHRCLARLDESGISGGVRVLRVLCDTKPAGTQGPVWYADGKVV